MSNNRDIFASKVPHFCRFAGRETEARHCRGFTKAEELQRGAQHPVHPQASALIRPGGLSTGEGAAGEGAGPGAARLGKALASPRSARGGSRVPGGGQVPARPLSLPVGSRTSSSCNHPRPPAPHPAARVSSAAMPEPAGGPSEVLARSHHEFPPRALSARGVRCLFCPSKFSGSVTSSSRKIHRFGRAIIRVTSSMSAA